MARQETATTRRSNAPGSAERGDVNGPSYGRLDSQKECPMRATDGRAADDEAPFAVEPIAIIGLACRLPGAQDAAQFWDNLIGGVESIRLETVAEQAARGVPEVNLR